jgi:hypothetical protein
MTIDNGAVTKYFGGLPTEAFLTDGALAQSVAKVRPGQAKRKATGLSVPSPDAKRHRGFPLLSLAEVLYKTFAQVDNCAANCFCLDSFGVNYLYAHNLSTVNLPIGRQVAFLSTKI